MLPSNHAINLNSWEEQTVNSFTSMEVELDKILALGYKYDRFGKKISAISQWIYAHDFISLFTYLTITRMQIDRDIANCDVSTGEEYYEAYQIQCLVDRFNCKEFDITPILDEFRLTKTKIGQTTGVGYDHITQNCPILTVA